MIGPPRSQSGETSKILILIGLIFQAILVAVLLLVGLVFFIIPFVGFFILAIAAVGILWLVLVYGFSYAPTSEGRYSEARTPTLVFGILSLLTLGIISGVLYIVAYAKLGDAEREAATVAPAWGAPPLNAGVRFCSACGRPNASGGPFCPTCGTRMN